MADIHKFRTNEAVNIEAAANWDVQTRLTISSQAHGLILLPLILLVLIMTLFYLLRQ